MIKIGLIRVKLRLYVGHEVHEFGQIVTSWPCLEAWGLSGRSSGLVWLLRERHAGFGILRVGVWGLVLIPLNPKPQTLNRRALLLPAG